jgi:hypothetical protein
LFKPLNLKSLCILNKEPICIVPGKENILDLGRNKNRGKRDLGQLEYNKIKIHILHKLIENEIKWTSKAKAKIN